MDTIGLDLHKRESQDAGTSARATGTATWSRSSTRRRSVRRSIRRRSGRSTGGWRAGKARSSRALIAKELAAAGSTTRPLRKTSLVVLNGPGIGGRTCQCAQ